MEPTNYIRKHDAGTLGSSITLEMLLAEFSHQDKLIKSPRESIGALIVRPANQWVEESRKLPLPKMLFDSFWFEGELCILFASSNQGKTILAVQISDSISKGKPVPGFRLETNAQCVLYFDFEMSAKQFETRYSEGGGSHYQWSHNFRRCEIDPNSNMPKGYSNFEDYVVDSIEKAVVYTKAKVLIIDNLTYLSTDTETAKGAAPLMKQLKALKVKYGLSLLILAHTPKRDSSKLLSQNDLQGSSRLIQFCDSCFAIGASIQGNDLKYLKQVKVRNTSYEYDSDNVAVCQVCKIKGFLHFERLRDGVEQEHLTSTSKGKDKSELIKQAKELHLSGKTQRDIAKELDISLSMVNRLLKSLLTA